MIPIRLGAVGYLNARPLVYGLDQQQDRFSLRFDVPSKCASLLHAGSIDLGLIPVVEYLKRPDYRVVPGVAIASMGAVTSVALFSSRPVTAIRSIAVDSGSRTSVALLRILCSEWFDIEPKFVTLPPDLGSMLKRCDAALMIGDSALFADYKIDGFDKIDLGEEWTAMTNLPFVWAFWAGRPEVLSADDVVALQVARDAGVLTLDAIVNDYCANDEERAKISLTYLRDNVSYMLDDQARVGLKNFFDRARNLRIIQNDGSIDFY